VVKPLNNKRRKEADMKEKIGQAAGEIWKVLGEKGQVGISRLPDIARMKADIAYQA